MKRVIIICAGVLLINACSTDKTTIGHTEITKWEGGKKGAVSITYDDGSINQFQKALPIMNNLKIPGTFFIITGQIPGSQYQGKFIGRPVKEIIAETATIPTNINNFYERSSAAGYLGLRGTREYHTRAGSQIDSGNPEEAYKIMDELYKKVRKGEFPSEIKNNREKNKERDITWDEIRSYAEQGHEFASHTVTHPYLCALDEVNILYELEKSREDILQQLGKKYTFSAEVPYGSEDERALEYANKVYPALRNMLFENYVEVLNRSNDKNPVPSDKEYVQWQRGALTETPLPLMKSWIDTTAAADNIWLVLVFHGVDGVGWKPLSSSILEEYFRYIKSKENEIWIATFADITRYVRERMNSSVRTIVNKRKITIDLTHSLDNTLYDLPLTLKTYVSSKWKEVNVKQGNQMKQILTQRDNRGSYVLYQAYPNAGTVEVSEDQI